MTSSTVAPKVGFVESSSNIILGVAGTASTFGLLGGLYKQVLPLETGFDSTSAAIFGGSLYAIDRFIAVTFDSIKNRCCSQKATDPRKIKASLLPVEEDPIDQARPSSCGNATNKLVFLTRLGISAAVAYKFTEFVAEKLNAPIKLTATDGVALYFGGLATVAGAWMYSKLADKVEAHDGLVAVARKIPENVATPIKKLQAWRETQARHNYNQQIQDGKIKGNYKADEDGIPRTPKGEIDVLEVTNQEQKIRRQERHEKNAKTKDDNKARRKAGAQVVELDPDSDGETRIKGDPRDQETRRGDKNLKKELRATAKRQAARHDKNAKKLAKAEAGEVVSDYEPDSDGEYRGKDGRPFKTN